jgi:hypothetical protein
MPGSNRSAEDAPDQAPGQLPQNKARKCILKENCFVIGGVRSAAELDCVKFQLPFAKIKQPDTNRQSADDDCAEHQSQPLPDNHIDLVAPELGVFHVLRDRRWNRHRLLRGRVESTRQRVAQFLD